MPQSNATTSSIQLFDTYAQSIKKKRLSKKQRASRKRKRVAAAAAIEKDPDIESAEDAFKQEVADAGLSEILPLSFGDKKHRAKRPKPEVTEPESPPEEKRVEVKTSVPGKEVLPPVGVNSESLKYWDQRYRLFSRYDEGCLMDTEGWFSVTPEVVSLHIAERCRSTVVVDPFAGCGGNVIQLAMTCSRVIAIEIDPVRLSYARHNAKIYGVDDRIEWILGDSTVILPNIKADVVFLSPPWGGPEYINSKKFDLKTMKVGNLDGVELFNLASTVTNNIAYFLPRNSRAHQLGTLAKVEVEKNFLNGKLKTITAYYGDLIRE